MKLSFDRKALALPFVKRAAFCKGVSLVMGILIAVGLPAGLVQQVPLVQAAAIINSLIIGVMIAVAGMMVWHPVLNMRLLPLPRGAIIAAFVHLDFVIYLWPDQSLFWQTILLAALYGALLDHFATRFFGDGELLMVDVVPPPAGRKK